MLSTLTYSYLMTLSLLSDCMQNNKLSMICVLQHYTYIQSAKIRAKVDELLNCEDIFLNALVADLTMRPAVHAYLTRLTMFPLCER